MEALSIVKNRLIDRILASKNEKLLEAIENILAVAQKEDQISLSDEQTEMLLISEQDIEYGDVISESQLDIQDSKWQY